MKQQILVYDDACPLCSAYSSAFVKAGLLPENGRQSFSEASSDLLNKTNPLKRNDEIPLINMETGQVLYGIDALLAILGGRFPFAKKAGSAGPVKYLLTRLYKLVSYNRRSIVATTPVPGTYNCCPTFNAKYRLLFLAAGLLFNSVLLFPLHHYLFTNSIFGSAGVAQAQAAHVLFVAANICTASTLKKQQGFEYAAQVNMLALLAVLLLLPLMVVNMVISAVPSLLNNMYIAMVTLFIIKEYFRRMQFAGILSHHLNIVCFNIYCLLLFLIYLAR
ncbi:hypothetical protein [Foetidibacter luteolus]|uniref:hypothetical protein n=1 Tax=Foetidibacter luteolus TaxID=2608880 RepID=UPI00129A25BF|nr:hypothetical protein [Foetidibacter luteolus]